MQPPSNNTSSSWRPPLFLITLPLLGVQCVWSTEMAFASPYLLSLGFPKSLMALVLTAAPLSGLLVQPIVGSLADSSPSRFGRRRPYMLVGCLLCGISMLALGFGRSFVSVLFSEGRPRDILTIIIAVLSIYLVDFTINGVMTVDRALLVDVLPSSHQDRANAWASRMYGLGNVAGFYIGKLDLPNLLPWLGSTQLQVASAITTVFLLGTHGLAAWHVKETPYTPPAGSSRSIRSALLDIRRQFKHMPDVVSSVCYISFWSSVSQFPANFYATVFIGNIYRATHGGSTSPRQEEEATRAGSRALFFGALVGLVASVVLPTILRLRLTGSVHRPANVILAGLWSISHAVFASVMLLTSFVSTVRSVTTLFAILGFASAVNHWAPFALIGEALLLESLPRSPSNGRREEEELLSSPDPSFDEVTEPKPGPQVNSGIIMGIHNVFIVIPQFIVIALSAVIFAIMEPAKHEPIVSDYNLVSAPPVPESPTQFDSISVIYKLAGFSSIVACILTLRLMRKLGRRTNSYPAREF